MMKLTRNRFERSQWILRCWIASGWNFFTLQSQMVISALTQNIPYL